MSLFRRSQASRKFQLVIVEESLQKRQYILDAKNEYEAIASASGIKIGDYGDSSVPVSALLFDSSGVFLAYVA